MFAQVTENRTQPTEKLTPGEWKRLVDNELREKGLASWITPMNPNSTSFDAIDGLMPLVPRTELAFKDWLRSYSKVSAAMTRSLGKEMMGIVSQPEYRALYSFCPALERYRTVLSILERECGTVSNHLT